MKTLILLITLPLLSFILNNDSKLSTANGIEKFVFGAPENSFKNMDLMLGENESSIYNVNPTDLTIPGVEFEYVRAMFTHNKLSAITFMTKNSTRGYFFKYLKENYGTPSKTSKTYEWEGENVRIVYEPMNDSREAAIDFYSKP